jgi:hypothetical protein
MIIMGHREISAFDENIIHYLEITRKNSPLPGQVNGAGAMRPQEKGV